MYNVDVLYGAYEQVASTPISEDATAGLMIASDRCGYTWADGEYKLYREFICHHNQALAKAFHEGKGVFAAAVQKCAEKDAEADG